LIPVEGRVLPGLDEFMLRVGHLKILCSVVIAGGGSWRRINQEAAARLKSPVKIHCETAPAVAEYLFRKRLCKFVTLKSEELESKSDCRYPDIVVKQLGDNSFEFLDFLENGTSSFIWWQDYCLADSRVRSKVGAVTTDAKSGSKTGFSHVSDWAIALDLISKNGQILPMGKLLAPVEIESPQVKETEFNPYVLGSELVILAFAYLEQDMDVFARLLPRITRTNQPLTPSTCGTLFVEALEETLVDGENSKGLSAGGQHRIYQQLRDLEKASRRSKKDLGKTSTAWHRAASRFETYVDIGLLDKEKHGSEEKFKYVYYMNPKTEFAVETLRTAESSREWIERHLSTMVFGSHYAPAHLTETDLLVALPKIVKRLALPTRLLPMNAVVLALVQGASEKGIQVSIEGARQSIENLARARSDLASLSRGTRGEKAEFVSINTEGMEA